MTQDEERLVLDNMKIAYKLALEFFNKYSRKVELEELQSLAFLGLSKAATTFNPELNFKFSTYAYTCIQHEIYLYLRQVNKHSGTLSLSEKIAEDLEIADIIADDLDISGDAVNDEFNKKLKFEIENLRPRYRDIMKYKLSGLTMIDIGNRMGLSQPQISRDYRKALAILRFKFKDWR